MFFALCNRNLQHASSHEKDVEINMQAESTCKIIIDLFHDHAKCGQFNIMQEIWFIEFFPSSNQILCSISHLYLRSRDDVNKRLELTLPM